MRSLWFATVLLMLIVAPLRTAVVATTTTTPTPRRLTSGTSAGMPDLIPEVPDWGVSFDSTVDPGDVAEGCAERATGVDLLRFSVSAINAGTADLALGDPMCPSPCAAHPLAICGNPDFICSPAGGHNHAHFIDFAKYELLDDTGQTIVVGHKQGFCLRDSLCPKPKYTCSDQGISVGCADSYTAGLGCQYIDVTGIAPGDYNLRVTLDPLEELPDLNRANNTQTLPVTIPSDRTTACDSANMIPAEGGTFGGVTTGRNTLTGTCSDSATAPEEVFQWTPAVSGDATFSTCSPNTSYDTIIYVRTGTCQEGNELACNDDTSGCAIATGPDKGSTITAPVTAGETYFIVVDGYAGQSGDFILSVIPPTPDAPSCAGDCNGDGLVSVNELMFMIDSALTDSSASDCAAGDLNQDGAISIDEILAAAANALNGCAGG